MPRVGNKHFPYTKAGYAAAAKARKAKGFSGEEESYVELFPEEDPPPSDEESERKVRAGNWEAEQDEKSTQRSKKRKKKNLKKGGKVGGARKHHRGCGCVDERRRKKTLYVRGQ